jgi:hypothetical protein
MQLLQNLKKLLVVLTFATLSTASALHAQVTGAITGRVTDPSGAIVSGAKIAATNTSTNFSQQAVTDGSGEYHLQALTPGSYSVAITAAGFQTFTTTGIDVKVNDQLRIDAALTVGGVEQNVSVQANAVQVEADSTQLGDVIESKEMLAMPLNGRSYLDLMALQPGVTPVTSGTIPGDRPVSGQIGNPGNLSVNGQPESGNMFLVNGGDVNESKNMGAGLIPNLDSIAEFRLITNSFDAEYGKVSGAVMNSITKSGTNRIHGDVFEFLRNNALDATNYFDTSKAELRRNQFGFAVGGPFWRDRLFWFSDYQGTRQVQGSSTGEVFLPTDAERAGQFDPTTLTGTVVGAAWANTLSQKTHSPVTVGESYASVFPNGIIPAGAIDTVSQNILPYIPHLNPGQDFYSNNSQKGTIHDNKYGERVDLETKRAGTLTFYYHFDDSTVGSPLNAPGQQDSFPGFATTSPSRAQMFVVSDVKTFGPSLVNEARLSYFRTSVQTANPTSGFASLSSLGFNSGVGTTGINPSGPAGYKELVPQIGTNEFEMGNGFLNLYQANNTIQGSDVISKIEGRHSLKFGVDFRYYQVNVRNICAPFGQFTFNGSETGNDFADYLLGAPNYYVQCTEQFQDNRSRYFGSFVQDEWKVKPNLTVNYGVRWDINMPWYDWQGKTETIIKGEQSTVFPLAPTSYLVPGDPGVPSTVSPTGFHNFAPRLGIAYSPDFKDGVMHKVFGEAGKSSIRAAYGIYYLGAADLGNFGIIGDAPFGIYWQSTAPSVFESPFETRATGAAQLNPFPFTFPVPGSPANKTLDFTKFYPLYSPGYNVNNRITYAEHYHLTLQRELSRSMVLTAGYVGTQGHRLEVNYQPNFGDTNLCLSLSQPSQVGPNSQTCGPYAEPSVFTTPDGSPVYGSFVGLNNQGLGETNGGHVVFDPTPLISNVANSNYNALQASIERRASDFSFLASYTYGKSFDNTGSGAGGNLNPFFPRQGRSLSQFNIKHNFVISYNYNLPFARAFGSVPAAITNGWTLSGITRATTGLPITLSEGDDAGLTYIGLDFPVQVAAVQTMNPRKNNNQYFNANTAFRAENLGEHSSMPARWFAGPGIQTTDLGVSKVTPIKEGVSFLLRLEFFNIFNHANFNNPGGNITNGNFGLVTSARDPRIGQVAAKITF